MADVSAPSNDLIKLANSKMPFGKYQRRALIDLPETYLVWFQERGFPAGELGRLLGLLYEIQLNGLEYLVRPLKGACLKSEDGLAPKN